jgi:hypothetical protein
VYEYAFFWDTTYLYFYHGIRGTNQSVIRWPLNGRLRKNRWNHVAWQRDSAGAWYAFIDGVEITQYSYSPLQTGQSFGALTTGRLTNSVDLGVNSLRHRLHGFDGYFSGTTKYCFYEDAKLNVGVAEYTGDFTIPPKPAKPFFNYDAVLTRLATETLSTSDPAAALSRLAVETLSTSDVSAALSRLVVEVLSSVTERKRRPVTFLILD